MQLEMLQHNWQPKGCPLLCTSNRGRDFCLEQFSYRYMHTAQAATLSTLLLLGIIKTNHDAQWTNTLRKATQQNSIPAVAASSRVWYNVENVTWATLYIELCC